MCLVCGCKCFGIWSSGCLILGSNGVWSSGCLTFGRQVFGIWSSGYLVVKAFGILSGCVAVRVFGIWPSGSVVFCLQDVRHFGREGVYLSGCSIIGCRVFGI